MMWLAAGIGGVFVVVLVTAWILTEGILHVRPERRLAPGAAAAAAALGRDWREVTIQAADGLALRAWYFRAGGTQGAVCILHGFTDSRAGMLDHIGLFLDLGYDVLAPDSRGHGASEGDLVTFGEREAGDAARWAGWLRREGGGSDPLVFGQSMGAAVALVSAPGARWAAVIAEAGYTRFITIAAEKTANRFGLPRLPGRVIAWPVVWLGMLYARLRYNANLDDSAPARVIASLDMPVLLIHGARDASISARHSEKLAAASGGWAWLHLAAAAGHTDAVLVDPDYRAVVLKFLTARQVAGQPRP